MLLAGKIFWYGEAAMELHKMQFGFPLVLISVWFVWLMKNRT